MVLNEESRTPPDIELLKELVSNGRAIVQSLIEKNPELAAVSCRLGCSVFVLAWQFRPLCCSQNYNGLLGFFDQSQQRYESNRAIASDECNQVATVFKAFGTAKEDEEEEDLPMEE